MDFDLVDEMLVEVGDLHAGELFEFGDGADADHVLRIVDVDPDGEAGAPEAVAGDVPVFRFREPVGETLVTDVLRRPGRLQIVLQQALMEVFNADVPCIDGAVDQRRVRTVAERVAMDDGGLLDKLADLLQMLDYQLVSVFDVQAFEVRDGVREFRLVVQRVDEIDSGGAANTVVVFTVGRSLVDDARTVRRGDIVVHEDAEGVRRVFEIGEDRFVVEADEIAAFAFQQDRVFLRFLVIGRNTFFRKDIGVIRVAILEEAVIDVRADADGKIFGQCPRGGRPDANNLFQIYFLNIL